MPPVKKVKPTIVKKQSSAAVAVPKSEKTVVSGQLDKKIKKQQQKAVNKRGVVFIKHLPHGFFEEQLKKYFEQFGDVTRLRLARSKRTGGSKGYAFVEFEYPEVAQVAAETMNNYLMFKKVVKASYIPPEMQRFNFFKSSLRKVINKAGKEIYVSSKTTALQRRIKEHNNWSDEAYQKRTRQELSKIRKLNKKYADLGIDFTKILIEPKRLTAEEKALKKEVADISEKNATAGSSKQITKASKRKTKGVSQENTKQKKTKKEIGLEDLLGNTIAEDSDDEDYIAVPASNNGNRNEVSGKKQKQLALEDLLGDTINDTDSEDETYIEGNSSDDDSDDAVDDDDATDNSDDDNSVSSGEDIKAQLKSTKKGKSTFEKPLKAKNVEKSSLEKLVSRKPHFGGIQKHSKKPPMKPIVTKVKKTMQLAAAKEIVKTQKPTKNKFITKAKTGGSKKQKVKK